MLCWEAAVNAVAQCKKFHAWQGWKGFVRQRAWDRRQSDAAVSHAVHCTCHKTIRGFRVCELSCVMAATWNWLVWIQSANVASG